MVWIDGPCLFSSVGWSTTRARVSPVGFEGGGYWCPEPHLPSLSHCSPASSCLQVVPDQLALLFQTCR